MIWEAMLHSYILDEEDLHKLYWYNSWRKLYSTPHRQIDPDGANMGPIWADRTQVDPTLAPWTLLFGEYIAIFDKHGIYVDVIGLCGLITFLIPFSFPLRWYCAIYPCIVWRQVDNMALNIDRSCVRWENIVFYGLLRTIDKNYFVQTLIWCHQGW